MPKSFSDIRDRIQQSSANDGDQILDRVLDVLDYVGSVEAKVNTLASPATSANPEYNHISLRHRNAREFTSEVTELLNEGWEFAAPPLVAAGGSEQTDLWVAFLRREAFRA